MIRNGDPRHTAFIMDGNGRWAKERGLARTEGHAAGAETVRRVVTFAARRGLEYLTLYAFSTENWNRPRAEVDALMALFAHFIEAETPTLLENDIVLRIIGDVSRLEASLLDKIDTAVRRTAGGQGLTLTLAVNYGGRDEIVRAVRRLAAAGKASAVTEESFSHALDTAGTPDPDLIVRTAGEMRLSNFLTWQAAYAEFYCTPKRWPDFSDEDFEAALKDYASRTRRFGGVDDTA